MKALKKIYAWFGYPFGRVDHSLDTLHLLKGEPKTVIIDNNGNKVISGGQVRVPVRSDFYKLMFVIGFICGAGFAFAIWALMFI